MRVWLRWATAARAVSISAHDRSTWPSSSATHTRTGARLSASSANVTGDDVGADRQRPVRVARQRAEAAPRVPAGDLLEHLGPQRTEPPDHQVGGLGVATIEA